MLILGEILRNYIKNDLKIKKRKNFKLLWASTREIFNVVEANRIGCHIITVPHELLSKIKLFNKNLNQYSRETVKTFTKMQENQNKINYK